MKVSVKQLEKDTNQPTEQQGNIPIPEVVVISPGEKSLSQLKEITKDDTPDKSERIANRKQSIAKNSVEPIDFAYERAIGKNDSLYSNFAELIALTKRKVCRIVIKEAGGKSYGTGFMVSRRLLLTNWHVFKDKQMADAAEAHFFYEYDAHGDELTPVIFRFDTTGFFNDRLLDYCFVAVQPMDVTGTVSLESIGYLYLDQAVGKVGEEGVEKLNIIHHPQGDYKQISIRENTFTKRNRLTIFYETDTAPGSSGSPVLNDQWQVVGLHHKSVAKMSDDKKHYLDKNGEIIPIIDGKIDATRLYWVKNEGIRISVILKHLATNHPNNELVAGLDFRPPRENLYFTTHDRSASAAMKNMHSAVEDSQKNMSVRAPVNTLGTEHSPRNININVPVDALSTDRSIEISLSSKLINPEKKLEITPALIEAVTPPSTEETDEFLEVAKADKEKAVDFSLCTGYDPNFLGTLIPLPRPKKAIEKQIARLINNEKEMELKYFKYSVIFNAVTKMPLISAINVEGDASHRLDNSKRDDDWLRDSRIDIDTQLNDKFYKKSNFDKGHMSRFEDANWDNTDLKVREKDALRNGIYTCFYTNACPQVANLNREGFGGLGLWGKLETAILERGIKKEAGKQARTIVFNGPIFNEQKDRIFKGVRIPMEYYKIILWLTDEGKLKATAFRLSQETLLGVVDFTAKADEALDIDKDIKFKNFQCSIKSLGKLTNIDFKHLEKFDTFVTNAGVEENLIVDTESITL